MLEEIADAVLRVSRPHPVRVGVDGRSAAGKSTLCGELAVVLAARGRPVLRASIDDFHRPGSQRADAPSRVHADDALRRRVRLSRVQWHELPLDGVLVAEASFLFRPELADHFDWTIWLDIDFETLLQRVRRRDAGWVGSEEEVVARYHATWIPVHELYERRERPRDRADVVVDNACFEEPRLVRLRLR